MKTMKDLKQQYNLMTNNGSEGQLINIGAVILFLPAILMEDNKYKIVRFISILCIFIMLPISMPIAAPFVFLGFIQFVYQEA